MNNLPICRDLFKVVGKDFDGKKYEKTSRILMQSFFNNIELWLDIQSYYFPIAFGDILIIGVDTIPNPDAANLKHLNDSFNRFNYLMSGVIFSIQTVKIINIKKKIIYASFGGLLMKIILPLKNSKTLYIGGYIMIGLYRV